MKIIRNKYFFLIVTLFFLTAFVNSDTDKYLKISKGIDLFGKVFKEINLNYSDEIDPEKIMLAGVNGMLSVLDPYSIYLNEINSSELDSYSDGNYGGIGVSISFREEKMVIMELFEGYPAERQGLRIGDEIYEINGSVLNQRSFENLDKLMKGTPGTLIKLKVKRPGIDDVLEFILPREEIKVNNITYAGLYPTNSKNAYIKLSSFNRNAGDELKNLILSFKKEKNINSLILDLRGNPGGLLDAAIDVSEKFIPRGSLIVSIKGKDTTKVIKYFSKEEPVANDLRVVVLINATSASASEIVAGAIQDYDRGLIVGETSFGKGLVQTVFPMPYKTSLKLTTAKYYTPSGRSIQTFDYTKDNDAFISHLDYSNATYFTSKGRAVYSSGGIKPDSIIQMNSKSQLVRELLAKSMFFKFASKYYNQNSNIVLSGLNTEKLINEFYNFLETENFTYQSNSEKLLNNFINELAKENIQNSKLIENINEVKKQFEINKKNDFLNDKNIIKNEILMELSSRINGRKGRIEKSLEDDNQLKIAYNLLQNQKYYEKTLVK